MNKNKLLILVFFCFLVFASACTAQPSAATVDAVEPTASVIVPTSTATQIPAPTATPTPTPVSYSWPQQPISIENAAEVTLLEEWGKGALVALKAVGNGEIFYAETLTKLLFFETDTMELLFDIPKPVYFAYSPSNQFMVGVDAGGTVSLASFGADGSSFTLEEGPATSNYNFVFSANEDIVAIARYPTPTQDCWSCAKNVRPEFHVIRIYDTATGELAATLDHGDFSPTPERIVISPDGTYLLVQEGGYQNRLGIWDITNERMVTRFLDRTQLPANPFNPNSDVFATFSENYVFFWDVKTGNSAGEYGTGLGWTYDLQFSANGEHVSLNRGEQIRKVSDGSLLTREEVQSVEFPEVARQESISLNLSSQKALLAEEGYFGGEGVLRPLGEQGFEVWMAGIETVWNPVQDTVLPMADFGYSNQNIYFSSDEYLLLSCAGGQASVSSPQVSTPAKFGTCDSRTRLAVSPNSGLVALANGSVIELYDWESAELFATLRAHQDDVQFVTFSDDGTLVASYAKNELFIWSLEGEVRRTHTLTGYSQVVGHLTFSPNNEVLVLNVGGGALGVWRLSDGQKLRDIKNDVNIYRVAFLEEPLVLLSGSSGDLYLWDYIGTRLLNTLPTGMGRISDIRIVPGSRGILAASTDGIVKLWGLND